MAKRKMSARARAAALRNLRKARAKIGRRRGSRRGTRRARFAARARRGGRRFRSFARRTATAPGIASLMRKSKLLIAVAGTVVNRLARRGFTQEAANEIALRYTGISVSPSFGGAFWTFDAMKPQVSGIALAVADDFVKRKIFRHYQRLGGKHILPWVGEGFVVLDSLACGSSGGPGPTGIIPGNIDWVTALACYQDSVSGYDPDAGTFDISRRWKTQFTVNAIMDGLSWLAGKAGVNRMLPKGWNA